MLELGLVLGPVSEHLVVHWVRPDPTVSAYALQTRSPVDPAPVKQAWRVRSAVDKVEQGEGIISPILAHENFQSGHELALFWCTGVDWHTVYQRFPWKANGLKADGSLVLQPMKVLLSVLTRHVLLFCSTMIPQTPFLICIVSLLISLVHNRKTWVNATELTSCGNQKTCPIKPDP